MKKDRKTVLSEYVRNLSEDDLKFLSGRLVERLSSDLSEALNFVSKNRHVDDVFRSAKSADELYDLCDQLRDHASREYKKRTRKDKD